MPTTDNPKSKPLLILLVSWAVAITALAALPVGEPPEVVSAAAASKAVIFQEEEQERQSILELRANPPTTTTAPPPTTTTTHYHPPTPKPQPKPQPASQPAPQAPVSSNAAGDPNSDASWDRLAQCESGGNWAISTGNGYYGGLQFSLSSWRGVGGQGYPHENSRAEQIHRGRLLYNQGGWDHWPGCTRKFGWR